jgi:hypothetical protein
MNISFHVLTGLEATIFSALEDFSPPASELSVLWWLHSQLLKKKNESDPLVFNLR